MKKFISLIFVVFLFFIIKTTVLAAEPRFFFDATEMTVAKNQEFELMLKIDSGGVNISGGDVVLEYNPEALEVLGIENSGFFPLFGKHFEINNKKIYITGFFGEKNQTKNGAGNFAKLQLKALKPGTTTIIFSCKEKSLADTNIIDVSSNDVLNCAVLGSLNIKVSGESYELAKSGFGRVLGTESGSLISPTPTAPATTSSATASAYETGVVENTFLALFLGAGLIVAGFLLFSYLPRIEQI